METRYSVSEMSVVWLVGWSWRWVDGESQRRTGDFVGEDGVEDFALFCLFFSAHDWYMCDLCLLRGWQEDMVAVQLEQLRARWP